MRLIFTILITKLVMKALRLFGGHGTALPGLIAEYLDPGVLKLLSKRFPSGIILVTGTNGKTSTAKIIRKILEQEGLRVFANKSGSNYTRGILSTIIEHATITGNLNYDIAVIEVDEAYMYKISALIRPKLIVVLNVMRDQLDRYGEIDNTATIIGNSLKYCEGVVLNYDDKRVYSLINTLTGDKKTTIFSVSKEYSKLLPSDDELHSETIVGTEDKARTQVELVEIKSINKRTILKMLIDNKEFVMSTKLEGIHNFANITAAVATVWHILEKFDDRNAKSIEKINPAFGRGEKFLVNEKLLYLSLIKNPGGFNQNIRAFVKDNIKNIVFIINDRYADGRDVSWLWDVDVEQLRDWQNKNSGKITCGGIRAYDMALRLQQDNLKTEYIDTNINSVLKRTIRNTPGNGEILLLPTYTAMLEVRKQLAKLSSVGKA